MKTEKPLLQSKTFWGGLIAVIPFVSEVLQDVAGLAIIPAPIGPIIAAAGGVLAILGRVVASKEIGGLIK